MIGFINTESNVMCVREVNATEGIFWYLEDKEEVI